MILRILGKPVIVALLSLGVLCLSACGESSEEKAAKQVCAASGEVSTQLEKLENLPISSSFVSEAQKSIEAINKSIEKVKEATPNLETARKEEVNAANKALQAELATLATTIISSAKSSNLESALKSAAPKLKDSLAKARASYKKAFDELKCS
ncbi:MAG TPA: hypothetical protein VEJ23_05975 [Solirubrobacteraceae bacterium]|nr:hypothetical protein [Solirubrobacteraceae bacterium]